MSTLPLFLNSFWLPGIADETGTAETSPVQRRVLDFDDPKDNLYAFGKLWAGYGSRPVFSAFHGLMFAAIGDQRLQPLFGYAGFGNFQARLLDNGNVKLRGKETGFFLDLDSGAVLNTWANPWTGETVEVFNFLNDRVRGELTPKMPRFSFGDRDDVPTLMNDGTTRVSADGSVPFVLPWQQYGTRMSLSWDYTHRYRNPVTPEKWPHASTGEFINPSEHFTFGCALAELEDPSVASAAFDCGFSRLSPFWPWMRMGRSGVDGVLFGRMHSHKSNAGFADIPRVILDYAEQHHPEYLQPCDDWDDGAPIGTWEAYARDVPAEQ